MDILMMSNNIFEINFILMDSENISSKIKFHPSDFASLQTEGNKKDIPFSRRASEIHDSNAWSRLEVEKIAA
jgi:hypothetical protein